MSLRAKQRRSVLRNTILAVTATIVFVAIVFGLLGRKETLQYAAKIVTERSGWKIVVSDYNLSLFRNRVALRDFKITSPDGNKEFSVGNFELKYRPWDFLRGKFYVSLLKVEDVKLLFPKLQKKEKKKLDITKLFFLQNIIIKRGIVKNLEIQLPESVVIKSEEVNLSLEPTLIRGTNIVLNASESSMFKADTAVLDAGVLELKASTLLSKWDREFPYINALSGSLDINRARLENISVDSLNAELKFFDDNLKLKPFKLLMDGKEVSGFLEADTKKKIWDAKIDIPDPVYLPYIGKPIKTIDTEGEVWGSIIGKGKDFIPSESSGEAVIDMSYRFKISPASPIKVFGKFSWANREIEVNEGKVTAKDGEVKITGSIDIGKKKVALKAMGKNFPAEAVFDKFSNPYFRRIFGSSDVEGTFEGWGKQFKITGKGVSNNAGYVPMIVEKAETEVEATYDRLLLNWNIIEGGKSTGKAKLEVKFGKKISEESRRKDLDLNAQLKGHPLGQLLPSFGLDGAVDGNLTISGPHTNFTGKADANIIEGKLFAIPFNKVSATLDIKRKNIIFRNIFFDPVDVSPISFPEIVTMDLLPGALKISGNPIPELKLDVGYEYSRGTWKLNKISYLDQVAGDHVDITGSVAKGGILNLKSLGGFDLKLLKPISFIFRDAAGPVDIDMVFSGSSKAPNVNGKIKLDNCFISPRQFHAPMEKLVGTMLFDGHKIFFDGIEGNVEDGTFKLNGKIIHNGMSLVNTDLSLVGKELQFRTSDGTFRMEFDGDLKLSGPMPSPLLSGDVAILDARYTKDFNILETVTGKKAVKKPEKNLFSPHLNLMVRNSGDVLIRNNVGDISLRTDVKITGARLHPKVGGTIEVIDGKIHYMGLDFDITRGFMEFRPESSSPYLEAAAQKEIGIYNVVVDMHGNIDNLALDLSATSPAGTLEKRDVISLLAFGMTEMEREQIAASGGAGGKFGVTMAAQQLTHVVERPITRFTHLDTFRLESVDPNSQTVSRVSLGKQLSDRLAIDFTTDINTTNAIQTFVAEYLFTDNLLLKGSRSTDGRYEMSGVLRFRMR